MERVTRQVGRRLGLVLERRELGSDARGGAERPSHHIWLVPGFLGFANRGRITYFGHVRRTLAERLTAVRRRSI